MNLCVEMYVKVDLSEDTKPTPRQGQQRRQRSHNKSQRHFRCDFKKPILDKSQTVELPKPKTVEKKMLASQKVRK